MKTSKARARSAIKTVLALGTLGLGMAAAQPYDKWVDAFFNNPDPFIQGTVIPNIEKNRKSDGQIILLDQEGKPLPGVKVSLRQIEHAFLWGSVPPFQRAEYSTPAFFKLWRDIYNSGIAEYAFKWESIEKVRGVRDFSHADAMLETAKASGAQMEEHFLAGYHPGWIDSIPAADRASAQRDYALAALDHYKDKILYYQVFNEDLYTHVARAKVFSDQTKFFGDLAKLYPNLRLGINDCYPWNPARPGDKLPTPDALKAKYPGIKFMAMHGHKPNSYWATPQEMYKVFDPYTGSGVKIQIAEFGIMDQQIMGGNTGKWTDDLRAQYFISAYATAFSHPATEAFNQWGIGPDTNRWTANYMINPDGTVKPSYNSVKSLVRDKFMTKVSGNTDATGLFKFRGFRGQYEVTVEKDGVSGKALLVLGDSAGKETYWVVPATGSLVLQGSKPVAVASLDPDADSGKRLRIFCPPGQAVVFTGLREARSLEILDLRGRPLRKWDVIGNRVEWDKKDGYGKTVGSGRYGLRIVSESGQVRYGALTF